jgi:hypothetical protein
MKMELIADAPIPGENYLSDTRNYPWHRPPEITDYDVAVDYLIDRLAEPEQTELIYSLIELKQPLTGIVAGLMMQSIGRGKIAIDLAILIAGPVYRYLQIIADQNGLTYESGLEDKGRIPITPTILKAAVGIVDDEEPVETPIAVVEATGEGLMGRPSPDQMTEASPDEQAQMLGLVDPAEDENAVQ